MSWLPSPPVDMISSLNIITDVLKERFSYMLPNYSQNGGIFEYLTRPCSRNAITSKMDYIASGIRTLYREHFPVKNFGRWAHWQPYLALDTNAKINPVISDELATVGIAPDGLIWNYPHRISDGNFIRACYHLLNNVLLYRVTNVSYMAGQTHVREWSSENHYDSDTPLVDEIVDGFAGDLAGYAAVGHLKTSMHCQLTRNFYQEPFSKGIQVTPILTGAWKGRYTTSISKALLYPQTENVQEFGEEYDIPGTHEINFFGTQGDDLPWFEDITKDLAYYKCWGNFQYGYAVSRQIDTLTEVFLRADNFSPNYQYFDTLE